MGDPDKYAIQAVLENDALLAIPNFDKGCEPSDTDFNDMARLYGQDAVQRQIRAAIDVGAREIVPESNATQPDLKPVIIWSGGQLPNVVEDAQKALLNHPDGCLIYTRSGQLVRIVQTSTAVQTNNIKKSVGTSIIIPVEPVWLQYQLTVVATWSKHDARSSEMRTINCPLDVPKALLSKAGGWPFPPLTAIIETPTLRPDGSILATPGYDAVTGLFYDPGTTTFPPISTNPSREDALEGLRRLSEILKGFPFREPIHHAVAIAAILTSLVRRSLRTAPMFIFTAPTMGSGKSLLADVVSLIATGHPATVMTQATSPDEERKRILAILMEGDSVCCIDNIERPLGGEALCSVLTQTFYKDRILGESRNVSVPTLTTWLATGNNV